MTNTNYQQVIYYGAPGTGKSHRVDEQTKGMRRLRVTIHPEYSYSDFIGQILPNQGENGTPTFEFTPGPMTQALKMAFDNTGTPVALILEELSRGNVAAIFGDMFQLLDRDDDGNSEYPVRNPDVANCIRESEKWIAGVPRDHIYFPSNLNIYATVNLNDQNVIPMDTAFKRRFEWEYVPISPIKKQGSQRYENNPLIMIKQADSYKEVDWSHLYMALNRMITDKDKGLGKNEDRQLGQFFIKFKNSDIEDSMSSDKNKKSAAIYRINRLLLNKLYIYLWQDVQGRGFISKDRNTIFIKTINTYQELYHKAQAGEQVFSDVFLNEFLAQEDAGKW